MLILVILILIAVVLCIYRLKTNKVTKKITLMYSIWTLAILGFSTLNLFGLYEVSDKVYYFWTINILIVVFCILIFTKKNIVEDKEKQKHIINRVENSKLIFYISAVATMVIIYYKVKYERIIANLPIAEIRMARFDKLFSSGIELIFFNYILSNSLHILLILTSVLIVNGKYKNKIVLLNIINLAVYSTIGYGRMVIFQFVIYMIISYLIFNYREKKAKIGMKKILQWSIFIILLIFIGASMTLIRMQGKDSLNFNNIVKYGVLEQVKQIYTYFTGGFRLLDHFIKNGFDNIEKLTLGRMTFGGVDEILGIALNGIGYNYKTMNSLIGPITQAEVQVGETVYMNAFYTCIMNYFADLGYIGIIIYPVLHGIFISYIINNYMKNKNLISFLLLSYVIMNLLCSIYRWNYQSGATTFTLIIMIILNMIIKRRNKNEGTLDSKHNISISSETNRN